jgi:hypothetical protein
MFTEIRSYRQSAGRRLPPAVILLGCALILAACGTIAPAITPMPSPTAIPFWQTISDTGDSGCAYETPFTFYYHQGGPDLLVYF